MLKNFPNVEYVVQQLRHKRCIDGCTYCNKQLNIHYNLKSFFGYDQFRIYENEPLQENAVQAATEGKSLLAIFPTMSVEAATAWMLIILIFIASFLTALGIYDRIGVFAGAGSIVPITGFSNSITSPAIEFRREGIIFGLCVKMFTVAGPVIVNGTLISVVVGIIYLLI